MQWEKLRIKWPSSILEQCKLIISTCKITRFFSAWETLLVTVVRNKVSSREKKKVSSRWNWICTADWLRRQGLKGKQGRKKEKGECNLRRATGRKTKKRASRESSDVCKKTKRWKRVSWGYLFMLLPSSRFCLPWSTVFVPACVWFDQPIVLISVQISFIL